MAPRTKAVGVFWAAAMAILLWSAPVAGAQSDVLTAGGAHRAGAAVFQGDKGEGESQDWDFVTALPKGAEIRVTLFFHVAPRVELVGAEAEAASRLLRSRTVSGTFISADRDSLTIEPAGWAPEIWRLRRTDIRQLTRPVEVEDPVGDGALIGLGIGAAAGFALGAQPGNRIEGFVLVLALPGFGVGALVDWLHSGQEEQVVYRASVAQ